MVDLAKAFPTLHYDHCLNLQGVPYREMMNKPLSIVLGVDPETSIGGMDHSQLQVLADLWARGANCQLSDGTLVPVDDAWKVETISMWLYRRYRQQVFLVDTLLQEAFLKTDLKNLSKEDINLPYPCFYVNLRDSPWFLLDAEAPCGGAFLEDAAHKVSGYYVFQIDETEDEVGLVFLVHCATGKFTFSMNIDRAFNNFDGVESYLKAMLDHKGSDTSIQKLDQEKRDYCKDLCIEILRLTIALLFYINKEDADLIEIREHHKDRRRFEDKLNRAKSPKKQRIYERRLTKLSKAKIIYVGKREQDDIRNSPGFDNDMPKHWRRGHFHKYWEGKRTNGDGSKIPVGEWSERRKLVRKWTLPTLINPYAEDPGTTRAYIFEEANYAEKQARLIEITAAEGSVKRVTLNKYERNQSYRRSCLDHYGATCLVCNMDFGKVYGSEAEGIIHVHHLVPVSKLTELGDSYVFDPIKDLRPLCPNCHAVVHRRNPPFTLEELQAFIA